MAPERALLSTEFLPALDWRPLHFEHPLPHARVCQVCGILSKETAQLPCFHTLCNVCYEGSVDLGCVCPLDREVFSQEGIDKLRLRPEQVLKLRVFCWNSVRGCNFVGPASELLDHFAKDCVYHKVQCPKCHQNVTRLCLVRHYVNDCDRSAEPSQPDGTYPVQLHQELEKVGAALTQSIAELKDGYYRLQTSCNTVADDVQIGLSEGKQDIERVSALLRELQRTQSSVNSHSCNLLEDLKRDGDRSCKLLEDLKRAGVQSCKLLEDLKRDGDRSCKLLEDLKRDSDRSCKLLEDLKRDGVQSCKLVEDLKSASVEIKQSIAGRNGSGQGTSAATGGGNGVQSARSEDGYRREAVILDTNMSLEMQRDAVSAATFIADRNNSKEKVADYICDVLWKKYKRGWHCDVMESPVPYVYSRENHYTYFRVYKYYILLTG